MAKARGRLRRGSFGVIEVAEGKVALQEERGIIRKRLVTLKVLPITTTKSTSLKDNQPPYRKFTRLTISYEKEYEQDEVIFFSQEEKALETIKEIIDADIERRRIELKENLDEQRRIRQAHVNHITLVLELLDHVFQILLHLDGEPRWGPMKRNLAEVGRIIYEMKELAVIAPLNYDANGLAAAVNQRLADGIKEECYALVSIADRDAERLANYEEAAKGFDLELHEIFVKSYLLLWDLILGERLGDRVDEEEIGELLRYLDKLEGHVESERCRQHLQLVKSLDLLDEFGAHFNRIRLLLLECLNSLVE
ncbi:MAG: hypothetical protein JSV18_07420 [Candidatus Bathyarchaeota archaeon]|nr:MAG: hypothetical protein JSV18_07420 [Candidatus Bathyarchaeota archaeon]